MGAHSCEPWTSLGINCPTGLLEAIGFMQEDTTGEDELIEPVPVRVPAKRKGPARAREETVEISSEEVGERDTDVVGFGHRKAKRAPPSQVHNAEMLMLLQLYKGARVVGTNAFPPLKIPVEIAEEAFREGARGRELGVWVAAAAASLAIGLRFGPSALQQVPRILLEGLQGRPGQPGRGFARGGGVGFAFNASRRLQTLLIGGSLRKLSSGLLGAAGEPDLGGSFGF